MKKVIKFLSFLLAFVTMFSLVSCSKKITIENNDHTYYPMDIDLSKYALVIYVSPEGKDSSMGTSIEKPVKTIERAKDIVRAKKASVNGDIAVVLREGVYYPSKKVVFDENDSGNENQKIVWSNYPGENAVISGGRKIEGWKEYKDGIYYADVDMPHIRNLFVNGTRATLARTPNVGEWYEMAFWDTEDKNMQIYTDVLPNLQIGSEVGIAFSWAMRYFRIKDLIDKDGITVVKFEDEEEQLFFGEYDMGRTWPILDNNEMFYAQNAFEYLDQNGEFYYDEEDKKLYFMPPIGVDLSVSEVYVPELEGLIEIKGSSDKKKVTNLVFNGLVFEHSGFTAVERTGFVDLQAGHYAVSQNEYTLLYDVPTSTVHIQNANNITVQNSIIRHSGGSAITCYLSCENINIYGNYITDISASGIMIAPFASAKSGKKSLYRPYEEGEPVNYEVHDILVKNNVINWIGMEYHGGIGICNAVGYNVWILNNEVGYTHYTGISNGWGWSTTELIMHDVTIAYNDVHHNLMSMEDGACFYNLNNVPNLQVRYNYFHDITRNKYASKSAPCYAIYLDEGTSNATVTKNVIDNANEHQTSAILSGGILFHKVGYYNYTLGNLYMDDAEAKDIIANCGVTYEYSNLSMRNDCSYGQTALTGVAMAQPENGFNGETGIKIELKKAVNVTALGRFYYYGNRQKHAVSIYDGNGNKIVEAIVDMGVGYADRYGFKYSRLETPIKLVAGTYYIVTEEYAGGDLYLGATSVITYDKTLFNLSAHVKIENGKISESVVNQTAYASGVVNFLYE